MIYKQKGYDGREVAQIIPLTSQTMKVSETEQSSARGLIGYHENIIRGQNMKTVDCVSQITESPLFILGSVEFIEKYIGEREPDYYPKFLRRYMRRDIMGYVRGDLEFFAKPSKYKRFEAGIFKAKDIEHLRASVITEVVNFVDEWRYYVSNGRVLTSWWYQGSDETCEKNPRGPNIDHIKFPKGFCGAVDFGMLDTGELALVESHHPYAIGWYGDGDDILNYVKFLIEGWEYLRDE